MGFLSTLKEKTVVTLDRFLEWAAEPNILLRESLYPRAEEVLAELLDTELTSDDLVCIAEQFCAERDRSFSPHLAVHDAVHALLDAGTTLEGERQVVTFQVENLCLDPNLLGSYQVAAAGAAMAGHLGWAKQFLRLYEWHKKERPGQRDKLVRALFEVMPPQNRRA